MAELEELVELNTLNAKQLAKEFKTCSKEIKSKDAAIKLRALRKFKDTRYLLEGGCVIPFVETLSAKKKTLELTKNSLEGLLHFFVTKDDVKSKMPVIEALRNILEANKNLHILQSLSNIITYHEEVKKPKAVKGKDAPPVVVVENEVETAVRRLSLQIACLIAVDLSFGSDEPAWRDHELRCHFASVPGLLNSCCDRLDCLVKYFKANIAATATASPKEKDTMKNMMEESVWLFRVLLMILRYNPTAVQDFISSSYPVIQHIQYLMSNGECGCVLYCVQVVDLISSDKIGLESIVSLHEPLGSVAAVKEEDVPVVVVEETTTTKGKGKGKESKEAKVVVVAPPVDYMPLLMQVLEQNCQVLSPALEEAVHQSPSGKGKEKEKPKKEAPKKGGAKPAPVAGDAGEGLTSISVAGRDNMLFAIESNRLLACELKSVCQIMTTLMSHDSAATMVPGEVITRVVKGLSRVVTSENVWSAIQLPTSFVGGEPSNTLVEELVDAACGLFGAFGAISEVSRTAACQAGAISSMMNVLASSGTIVKYDPNVGRSGTCPSLFNRLLSLRRLAEQAVVYLTTYKCAATSAEDAVPVEDGGDVVAEDSISHWQSCKLFFTDDSLFNTVDDKAPVFSVNALSEIIASTDEDLANRGTRIASTLTMSRHSLAGSALEFCKAYFMADQMPTNISKLIEDRCVACLAMPVDAAAVAEPVEKVEETEKNSEDLPESALLSEEPVSTVQSPPLDRFINGDELLCMTPFEALYHALIVLNPLLECNVENVLLFSSEERVKLLAELLYKFGPIGSGEHSNTVAEKSINLLDSRHFPLCRLIHNNLEEGVAAEIAVVGVSQQEVAHDATNLCDLVIGKFLSKHFTSPMFLRPLVCRALSTAARSYAQNVTYSENAEVPFAAGVAPEEPVSNCTEVSMRVCRLCFDVCVSILLTTGSLTVSETSMVLMTGTSPSVVSAAEVLEEATDENPIEKNVATAIPVKSCVEERKSAANGTVLEQEILESVLLLMDAIGTCGVNGLLNGLNAIYDNGLASVDASYATYTALSPLTSLIETHAAFAMTPAEQHLSEAGSKSDTADKTGARPAHWPKPEHFDSYTSKMGDAANASKVTAVNSAAFMKTAPEFWPFVVTCAGLLSVIANRKMPKRTFEIAISALNSLAKDARFHYSSQPVVIDVLCMTLLCMGAGVVIPGGVGRYGVAQYHSVGIELVQYIFNRGNSRESDWTAYAVEHPAAEVVDTKKAPAKDAKKDKKGAAAEHSAALVATLYHAPEAGHPDPNHGPNKKFWLNFLDLSFDDTHLLSCGSAPLFCCIQSSLTTTAVELIELGVDVNVTMTADEQLTLVTPLMYSLLLGDANTTQALIAASADVNVLDGLGNPLLKYAFLSLPNETVDQVFVGPFGLIPANSQVTEAKEQVTDESADVAAASPPKAEADEVLGNCSLLPMVMEAQVDVNVSDAECGNYPLHFGTGLATLRITIGGYTITVRNESYHASLDCSETRSQAYNIITELVEYSADPNSCNSDGITAVHVVAARADTKSLEYLLKAGAHPNMLDKAGYYPIHYAAAACAPLDAVHAFDMLLQRGVGRAKETAVYVNDRVGKAAKEKYEIDLNLLLAETKSCILNPSAASKSRLTAADILMHHIPEENLSLLQLAMVSHVLTGQPTDFFVSHSTKQSRTEMALHVYKTALKYNLQDEYISHMDAHGMTFLHGCSILFKGLSEKRELNYFEQRKRNRKFANVELEMIDVMMNVHANTVKMDALCTRNSFKKEYALLPYPWCAVHGFIIGGNHEFLDILLSNAEECIDRFSFLSFMASVPALSEDLSPGFCTVQSVADMISQYSNNSQYAVELINENAPLHVAIKSRDAVVLSAMLRYCDKLDLNTTNLGSGRTPIHDICELGYMEGLQLFAELISSDRLDLLVEDANCAGCTCISAVIDACRPDLLKILMDIRSVDVMEVLLKSPPAEVVEVVLPTPEEAATALAAEVISNQGSLQSGIQSAGVVSIAKMRSAEAEEEVAEPVPVEDDFGHYCILLRLEKENLKYSKLLGLVEPTAPTRPGTAESEDEFNMENQKFTDQLLESMQNMQVTEVVNGGDEELHCVNNPDLPLEESTEVIEEKLAVVESLLRVILPFFQAANCLTEDYHAHACFAQGLLFRDHCAKMQEELDNPKQLEPVDAITTEIVADVPAEVEEYENL